jgi:hypothetical protein
MMVNKHLDRVVKARCVATERVLAGFRERRAAGTATIPGSLRFGESESLGGSVFAFSARHDRPLALKAGRADNRVEV